MATLNEDEPNWLATLGGLPIYVALIVWMAWWAAPILSTVYPVTAVQVVAGLVVINKVKRYSRKLTPSEMRLGTVWMLFGLPLLWTALRLLGWL